MTIKTAADGIFEIFCLYFSEKIKFDISCESSAQQMIHMTCQALFSLNIFRTLQQFCLRVKRMTYWYFHFGA